MGNRMNGRFNPLAGRSMRDAALDLVDAPTDALAAIDDDGTITLGAFALTPKGLQISGSVTEDEWLKVGGAIRKLQSSVQFLIGDWLAYGEREWGRTYEEAAGLFGYAVNSLYTFAWVCKAVKISIRMEKLEFGHHALVAGLPPDEQRYWLRHAALAETVPSVAQMRRVMAGLPLEAPPPPRGVAKLEQGASRLMARADGLVKKGDAESRLALRQLADEQELYWRQLKQLIDEQDKHESAG